MLAQIDDRPYVILKAQYEGQLAHDQGLLSQAQMDLKRYQMLAQAKFDRQAAGRGSGLHRAAIPRHGETRSGADRRADAQHRLLPHRLSGHRPHRAAPGRSGQLRAVEQRDRHRRRHRIAADYRDLRDSRRRSAGHHAAIERRHQTAGHRVRPRQCQKACRRHRFGRRQSDQYHHRHRERARAVRQCRQRAVSQPVRQCSASGEDAAERA